MLDAAVFVSGSGTNLQAIIDRIADGSLRDVRIACVIASRSGTYAETRAKKAGIPCQVIRKADFPDLAAYDQALLNALSPWPIGLVVLAGFLSLLGPDFIKAFRNKIINIHPALIPSFCGHGLYGVKPHEAALEYGVRISGATVHFINENYDEGPIILQKAVPVLQDDTPQSLQLRIMEQAEQVILPQAIALFAQGRLEITGHKVIIKEVTT
jgi:phosphoribosylglycinamide formyltransferase 1